MNGHHSISSLEGEELPSSAQQRALELLLELEEKIQHGTLDTHEYEEALRALKDLRDNTAQAPAGFRHHLLSAATSPDRPTLEHLQRAIEGAKPIRTAKWGVEQPTARKWLVEDWLPAGRVTMLTGEGGAGKSRLALQLAAGIASGGSDGAWLQSPKGTLQLGNAVPDEGTSVVFASWEDEPDEFYRRLHQISGNTAPWVTPERLENLTIANMMGEGPVWAPAQGSHISSMAELTRSGERIRRLCQDRGARFLIIDPLAAAYASQENSRGLVRAFVSHWDDWAQANDCTVLLLAHPPKSSAYSYAGSTDWLGAVRALWSLQRVEQPGQEDARNAATWRLDSVKGNYRGPTASVQLRWDASAEHLRWKVAGDYGEQSARGGYDYDS